MKKKTIIVVVSVLLAIGYLCGYYALRRSHNLIHRGTYYTMPGREVRTDTIQIGRSRENAGTTIAYYIYTPLRWAEAFWWRRVS